MLPVVQPLQDQVASLEQHVASLERHVAAQENALEEMMLCMTDLMHCMQVPVQFHTGKCRVCRRELKHNEICRHTFTEMRNFFKQ